MVETGGKIQIKSWYVPDVEAVAVSIQDSGGGIAGDHLAHIFDPFFTTKRRGEGTGLGLYIAGEIIKRHEGWIRAQNLYDDQAQLFGAQFTIMLPAA